MNGKKILLVISLCILLISFSASEQKQANLLSDTHTPDMLKKRIIPREEWHPFPKADEHDQWQKIPDNIRISHIQQAEKHLNCDWETPKASVFLEFVRTGNRSNYQRTSFGRRIKLTELVLAECMEGQGRFLDDILNGIWAICEETYWGVPAHVSLQSRRQGLPDVTEPTVDLFAAETGMLLAWIDYLLGSELDKISPLIRERIHHEVQRRIISVNLERDDFWWMGSSGTKVNNWNPWICSNWLTAVLILEKDSERRIQSIHKIMRCLDNFMNSYPKDGGCDEGPSYWNRAAGSLYDCLELLHSASKGKIDIFDKPLIREMGKYIYHVYINGPYFVNFADAPAKLNPNPSLIFRYGKSIKDEKMIGFAAFLAEEQNLGENIITESIGSLGRVLPLLFHLDELFNAKAREPLARDNWLPELQVMTARTKEGSHEELYVAAKGGHNNESHNHNDVGNFIIYADGYPALIDVGVETYTAKTFSDKRYEIWTMQSAHHNLPTINGSMQKNGIQFKATDVSYKADRNKTVFSLDISKAYPDEAQIQSWKRSITLNRGLNVTIRDEYELSQASNHLQLTLMSWRKPELVKNGTIRLQNPEEIKEAKTVFIMYDRNRFDVNFETVPLKDPKLQASWGEQIYRISLTEKKTSIKGEYSLSIVQY